MGLVAVIPVKHNSERVESKNFRPFYNGKSLLEIKIQQLRKTLQIDQIYVSSNSPDARALCEGYGIEFLPRAESLCNNVTPWSEVIYEVINSVPVSSDTHVAWCHTTTPNFDNFDKAIEDYFSVIKDGGCNGLVAVSPCKEFIVDDMAQPVNYSWGAWHKYSQYLRKYFFISGALFLTTKSEYLRNRYVISTFPHLFVSSPEASIDIDTEFDFEFAQYVYSRSLDQA